MKKIILTADDYGANDFIDKGIIDGIKSGIINSVAAFVTFKDSKERIEKLIALKKSEALKGNLIGIGLHFSITAGWPIIKKHNTLSYPNINDIIFRDATNYPFERIKEKEIQAELSAQIELLASWLGGIHEIDHVSNHHGVTYLDTSIFRAYSSTIKNNYQIPIRSPLAWSKSDIRFWDYDTKLSIPLGRQGIELGWTLQLFETFQKNIKKRIKHAEQLALKFPYCFNDSFYGQPYVENINFLLEQFAENKTAASVEFMFHLGYYEKSPHKESPHEKEEIVGINSKYFSFRKLELAAIKSYNWNVRLQEMEIEKIVFRSL
jgi:predicted glycoside hydrolase/deacetylase ChbG (UPF0249 family)